MALPALTWEHRDGKKTSYRRPVDNCSPRSSRSPTVSPCCNTVQVSPIHTAFSPRRDEPGRTVAPPWRTGKNRSVTGVLPAWTWVNRGEPAREPCKRRDEPWPCRGSTWMNRGAPGCSRVFEGLDGRPSRFFGKKTSFSPGSPRSMNRDDREAPG